MANHEGFSDPTAEEAIRRAMGGEYAGKHAKGRHLKKGPVSLVYICSRFAGADEDEVKEHILQARRFSRFALTRQAVPVTPHLMYPQFLRDSVPQERELGIAGGLKILRRCDELWVFVVDRISEGMRLEIEAAEHRKIPVRYFDEDMREVNFVECDL